MLALSIACVHVPDGLLQPLSFVLNGLEHANVILGEKAFDPDAWEVIGEYCYNKEGGKHQAFYSPTRHVDVLGQHIRPGERVQVEQSLKYSFKQAQKLWSQAAMIETKNWIHGEEYGKQLCESLFFPFRRFNSPEICATRISVLSVFPDTFYLHRHSPRPLRPLATHHASHCPIAALSHPSSLLVEAWQVMATPVTGPSSGGCPRHLVPFISMPPARAVMDIYLTSNHRS